MPVAFVIAIALAAVTGAELHEAGHLTHGSSIEVQDRSEREVIRHYNW